MTRFAAVHESGFGRYCCKTLFALLIKNSPGYRRDFRVIMWGTSCPDDKLVSDLAKAAEATKISARRSDRLMAGKKIKTPFLPFFVRHTTKERPPVLTHVIV